MKLPPALRPGDTIAAFAGSSPFDRTLVWRGLGWLKERYRVVFEPGMFERTGYLAGSDSRRRDELARWLGDARVKALIAARGGYGLNRIAHELDWRSFAESPKWIVGFSDATVLHVEAARAGVASIHGPNIAGVGRSDDWTRSRFLRALEDPAANERLDGLTTWASGHVEGPLFGGNLTMLHACAVAGRLSIPRGSILVIEDVTERPYRIDRVLTTLRAGGHLEAVAGVLCGEWTDCTPGPDGVRVEDVLRERLCELGVPVLANAPVGHGRYNAPLVLGRRWNVDGTTASAATID